MRIPTPEDKPVRGIIYLAVNRVNQKAYVGQTTMSLGERAMRHFTNNVKRSLICVAMKEVGFDAFDFAVLAKFASLNEAAELEKYWIARLGSRDPEGYNVSAGRGALGVKLSAARRSRLSEFRKRQWQDPVYRAKRIKEHWANFDSPEVREKIRQRTLQQHREGSLGSEAMKRGWVTRKANRDA